MATKIRNTYSYRHFQLLSACKIGHRCQIGKKLIQSPQIHPFEDPESFSIGRANLAVHFQSGNKNTLRIFVAIFSLYWPVKSAIGARSGQNFLNGPQIQPFDDPENFSSIGPTSLAVHFQSGNKSTYFAIFSFYFID